MTWRVIYAADCQKDLRRMHRSDAQNICEAVQKFARTGRGFITGDLERNLIRIEAAAGFAVVQFDEDTKTVHVGRLVADRPLPHIEPLLDDPDPPDDR